MGTKITGKLVTKASADTLKSTVNPYVPSVSDVVKKITATPNEPRDLPTASTYATGSTRRVNNPLA